MSASGRCEPMQPVFNIWIGATGRLPDDPAIYQCVLVDKT